MLDKLHPGLREESKDVEISDDDFQKWLNDLDARLGLGDMQAARRFLQNNLRLGIRRLGWKLRVPPNIIKITDQPPLLDSDTIAIGNTIYPILERWAESFEDTRLFAISNEGLSPVLHRLRAGQLLLGVILLGGLLHKKLIAGFIDSFPNYFWVQDCWVWTDIYHTDPDTKSANLIRRIVGQPICEIITLAWVRQQLGNIQAYESRSKRDPGWTLISDFLDEYVPGHGIRSLSQLISRARSFVLPELDSIMLRVASLKLPCTPLAENAWWRLITGKALDRFQRPSQRQSAEERVQFAPRELQQWVDGPRKNSMKALRELQKILSPRIEGKKVYFDGVTLYPDQVKRIHEENLIHITTYLTLHGNKLAPIVYYLACWAEHMLLYGTRVEHSKNSATIYSYFTLIASFLIEIFGTCDPISLDGESLIAAYSAVLDQTSPPGLANRLGRLVDFQRFLENQFIGADLVDWEAFELAPFESGNVRANLLTPREYQLSLRLLAPENLVGKMAERECVMAQGFLVISYQFGPRIGETTLLRMSDVAITNDMITVSVRKSDYQTLKTPNANRRIDEKARLSAMELAIVRRVISFREAELRCSDADALIFASADHPNQPLNRDRFSDYVISVLRTVSGDPTISAHTMRHGFGTFESLASSIESPEAHISALIEEWCHPGYQWRIATLGNASETRRSLWAVAHSLGHSSIATTMLSYVHLTDIALGVSLSSIPCELGLKALANLSGVPSTTLHKFAARNGVSQIKDTHRRMREEVATTLDKSPPFRLLPLDRVIKLPDPNAIVLPADTEFDPNLICNVSLSARVGMVPSRIARKFHVAISTVHDWLAAEKVLKTMLTRRGKTRHLEQFRVRSEFSASEKRVLSRIQSGFRGQSPVTIDGLRVHANYKIAELSYVDIDEPADARTYIAFLLSLGFPSNTIEIQPGEKRRGYAAELVKDIPGIIVASTEVICQATTGLPAAGSVRVFVRLNDETGSLQVGVKNQKYSTEHYWVCHFALVYAVATKRITR